MRKLKPVTPGELRAQAAHDTGVAERSSGTKLSKIKQWAPGAVHAGRTPTRA